ncbi:MAG: cytochrome c oxidase subunit II [Bacillus sp. (in: firmicutes)]
MKKRLGKWRSIGLLTMLTLLLAGCGEPFLSTLTPAGEVGQKQYDLMVLSTLIMVLVIIVVTVIFLIVMFRFRRKKGDTKIPKQVEGSHKMEIVWTVIPIILLIILAVPTVSYTFQFAEVDPMNKENEDGKRDVTVVNVRANAYWWEFEYPDAGEKGVVTSQDLVVPTGERVYFNLTASDIKHSFWIPAAGGKMDTNTDNENQFYLTFDENKADEAENLFYGKCAELCGPSHALMDFKVVTKSKEEFNQWLDDMATAEAPQAEGALAEQGEEIFNESCISCHAVTPNEGTPVPARLAPNLSNFGERTMVAGILENNEENVKDWIKNSDELKPGNKMPSYNDMAEEDIEALTAYLMQLKVQE